MASRASATGPCESLRVRTSASTDAWASRASAAGKGLNGEPMISGPEALEGLEGGGSRPNSVASRASAARSSQRRRIPIPSKRRLLVSKIYCFPTSFYGKPHCVVRLFRYIWNPLAKKT
ncbi:hypothetical protein ACM44_09215 [Chryseobacterium koreense CCUG 49689]|uniref:Uncharacterized protein n=1 Tax=Chryseobacterium koreense CCUG 49689 TaxID=1304281 RepID=A0A0J7IXT1_9FLAO|nr:hypothetical protein ACM44_09215 [Chryseobacterium koreense CCUG 49689]